MPTCLTCTLMRFVPKCGVFSPVLHPLSGRSCLGTKNTIRFLSHSENKSSAPSQAAPGEVLTLLHKTTSFLPRVLSLKSSVEYSGLSHLGSYELWNNVLYRAFNDVNNSLKPLRIVVYGVDEWAPAQELVTALLEDPLSSDESQSSALRNRWRNPSRSVITIKFSAITKEDSGTLQISSPYLTRFRLPIEIIEIAPSSSALPQNEKDIATLFAADIPIIVCNPVTVTPSTVLAALPSHAVLVLTSLSEPNGLIALKSKNGSSHQPKVLSIDPRRAMNAVSIFKTGSNLPSAIQRYQDDFTGSHISDITHHIESQLDAPVDFRRNAVVAQLRSALNACEATVKRLREELSGVFANISHLSREVEETKARTINEIFVIQRRESKNNVEDELLDALELAKKEMAAVLSQLTWWRMIWRVDEISNIVTSAIVQAWCKDLEEKLILHTGRLSSLQNTFTSASFSLLSSTPHPLNSSLLRNNLLQLQSSPAYTLSPHSLTTPLHTRREQLSYPTARLHLAGQQTVLGMSGGIATGTGVAWAGWFGCLTGTADGLFSFVGLEPITAVGVGALGVVGSVRWAIGRWEKAKKRWWQDWNRVGEGFDRDLKGIVDEVLQKKVTVVADNLCFELSKMGQTRKEEIERLEEELEYLRALLSKIKRTS